MARFFVYGLLGADYDDSPYTQQGERVARLAVSGIRLVIDEFRADVTKTRKDGSKGALRIDYGDGRAARRSRCKWLWKFVDGAKTAGELYGRALVVIAAEQYASRLVVPQSQRHAGDPLVLAQGPGRQGAGQARRAASPGVAAPARGGDQARARGARPRHPARPPVSSATPPALRRPPTTRRRGRGAGRRAETDVDVEVDDVEESDEAEQ